MKRYFDILLPLCALLFVSTKMRTMSQQCVNSWQIADLFMDDAFPIEKIRLKTGFFVWGKKYSTLWIQLNANFIHFMLLWNIFEQYILKYGIRIQVIFLKRPQNFDEISHLIWRLPSKIQFKWNISPNFCGFGFPENLDFNRLYIKSLFREKRSAVRLYTYLDDPPDDDFKTKMTSRASQTAAGGSAAAASPANWCSPRPSACRRRYDGSAIAAAAETTKVATTAQTRGLQFRNCIIEKPQSWNSSGELWSTLLPQVVKMAP